MEWKAPSGVSTLHRAWRKDWKGWKRPDDDRAAARRVDQRARFAAYRHKKFPRALARDGWIQRRLKKGLECGLSTATRLCPSAQGCRFGYPGSEIRRISFSPGLSLRLPWVRDSSN